MFNQSPPTPAHDVLTKWTRAGRVRRIITQNVDGLHQRSGADCVTDLHGRIDRVICLKCKATSSRSSLQGRLKEANEHFIERALQEGGKQQPDGDFQFDDECGGDFNVCTCSECGGILKPDVTFFGDNVPKDRVDMCMADVNSADAVLVIGSTLSVYSAFRFVQHAARLEKPIAVVNLGETRSERSGHPVLKINMKCDEAMVICDGLLK
mmetsp:Transcript_94595/g.270733  ORF Transcript_94595/g.270733 Transcript_94595/m.270733 type:complete len:209 (+) Transcript_94595:480-1106(+)